jgi:Flp pilus assembly protein TadD
LKAGDAPAAVSFLQRARDGGEYNAAMLGALAEAQFRTGNLDVAKTTLAQALTLDPKNAELQRLKRVIR